MSPQEYPRQETHYQISRLSYYKKSCRKRVSTFDRRRCIILRTFVKLSANTFKYSPSCNYSYKISCNYKNFPLGDKTENILVIFGYSDYNCNVVSFSFEMIVTASFSFLFIRKQPCPFKFVPFLSRLYWKPMRSLTHKF